MLDVALPAMMPEPSMDQPSVASPVEGRSHIRRIGWLHFANDFTLDFLTPLLPAGVGVAWLGVMEGAADAIGQVLKLFTGRASDRSGVRTPFVRWGYLVNAVARPLTAIGLFASLPWWIIACRLTDRVGKGIRGSATDALVADWTSGDERDRAYNQMRAMDHLGAAVGGLAAAGVAWLLAPDQLWMAVAALVVVTAWVAWLTRGLRDRPREVAAPAAPAAGGGWWPSDPSVQRPLAAIGIAAVATKLSPLLVLVQVAGLPAEGSSASWPLWQICLGWAALGVVQAVAASAAGAVSSRVGAVWLLRCGWLATTVVFVGLALTSGPWLIACGLGYGIVAGLLEGSEKVLVANRVERGSRGIAFGALALLSAIAGLAGNAVCGALLAHWSALVFLVLAAMPLLGLVILGRGRSQTSG